ncbi:hypothetical protein SUGI_0803800 [Cryptomeria japonica]|nr:hypothetical protein SUGI_0803800 [Cryptomeria japonica]
MFSNHVGAVVNSKVFIGTKAFQTGKVQIRSRELGAHILRSAQYFRLEIVAALRNSVEQNIRRRIRQ